MKCQCGQGQSRAALCQLCWKCWTSYSRGAISLQVLSTLFFTESVHFAGNQALIASVNQREREERGDKEERRKHTFTDWRM